jgi:hypothetical protein
MLCIAARFRIYYSKRACALLQLALMSLLLLQAPLAVTATTLTVLNI